MSTALVARAALVAAAASLLCSVSAHAQSFALTQPHGYPASIFQQVVPDRATRQQSWQDAGEADESAAVMPAHLRRQTVAYSGREAPGTIVIDTANTYLYYVQGGGRAIRYGIGVGREGFTWAGVRAIDRKVEWPDWHPPAEMIARQPYLPRFMAGGPGNPLGARAMYLGGTLYRIHGTNQPSSIGQKVSSGCIRLLNEDVVDLFNRANIGTKVVVLPDGPRRAPADLAYAQEPQGYQAYARGAREREAAPLYDRYEHGSRLAQPTLETSRPLAGAPGERGVLYYGSSASRLY
jgi:lipoprotein-anchoring transpeptidase ErfK/SrfK